MACGECWFGVLQREGLPPLTEEAPPEDEGQGEADGGGGCGCWGGGKSPEHLILKQYALALTELFDAPTVFAQAEHQLLSGAVIAVFLQRMNAWTGMGEGHQVG